MTTLQRSDPTRVGLMKAATVVAPGKLEVWEVPIPSLESDQVRIRIEGCGVCASNIPPWEGREWFQYPLEPGGLGHEGWGIVDAAGENVRSLREGDRVAFLGQHSYAEFDVAAEDSVVRIPESLGTRPVPAEPLGCAINIVRRAHIQPGDTVAIVGIGFLGCLLTQLCTAAGARVLAIARKEEALQLARRMGAAETIRMGERWEVVNRVSDLTAGHMCDVVIEAVGKQEALDFASDLTREMGRLVIAGYHQDGLRQVNVQLWNWRGLEVTNAHERESAVYRRGMEEAIDAIERGALDPLPLFTHRFELKDLGSALDMTRERPAGFMKALVYVGASKA